MNYQERLEEKEIALKEAEQRQDALKYYMFCNQLGISPKDQFLYQRGEIEFKHQKKEYSRLEKIAREVEIIIPFLKEAGRFPTNRFEETEAKKELLIKYFPEKFGPNGRQNIEDYSPAQTGTLFNNVVNTYYKHH